MVFIRALPSAEDVTGKLSAEECDGNHTAAVECFPPQSEAESFPRLAENENELSGTEFDFVGRLNLILVPSKDASFGKPPWASLIQAVISRMIFSREMVGTRIHPILE